MQLPCQHAQATTPPNEWPNKILSASTFVMAAHGTVQVLVYIMYENYKNIITGKGRTVLLSFCSAIKINFPFNSTEQQPFPTVTATVTLELQPSRISELPSIAQNRNIRIAFHSTQVAMPLMVYVVSQAAKGATHEAALKAPPNCAFH